MMNDTFGIECCFALSGLWHVFVSKSQGDALG